MNKIDKIVTVFVLIGTWMAVVGGLLSVLVSINFAMLFVSGLAIVVISICIGITANVIGWIISGDK